MGQTESDLLADCLYKAAIKHFPERCIRKDYSGAKPANKPSSTPMLKV